MQDRSQRGFTLIEAMIVVAIIAIIAGIALPAYLNYVSRSKAKVAAADVMGLTVVVESYRQRTLDYPEAGGVEQFSQWHPSSSSDEFIFDYEPTDTGYVVNATWQKGGRLEGCVMSVTNHNVKQSQNCMIEREWK